MNDKKYHPNTNTETAKAVGYALVKYASQRFDAMDFDVCIKTFKGGVTRVWIETRDEFISEVPNKEETNLE